MDRHARTAQLDESHGGHSPGPEAGRQELLRLGLEAGQTRRIAEIVEGTLVFVLARRSCGINHHSADWIPFGHESPQGEM
jgi:hypothetical protein